MQLQPKHKLMIALIIAAMIAAIIWQFRASKSASLDSSNEITQTKQASTTTTEQVGDNKIDDALTDVVVYQSDEVLPHIYQDVLLGNSQHAVLACEQMQQRLQNGTPEQLPLNDAFTDLAKAWKQVQASYILPGYDAYITDYPRLIDFFDLGNEDLSVALQRALQSDNEPKAALFKNSYKSINALEIILNAKEKSPRQQLLAQQITDNICTQLTHITQAYEKHKEAILSNDTKAVTMLLNALVDSSYEFKEKRIGSPAGLSKKYPEASSERMEYPLSNASVPAMQAILSVHQQLIAADKQPNLATYAYALADNDSRGQAQSDIHQSIAQAQADLKALVTEVNKLPKDAPLTADNAKAAYQAAGRLQQQYYENVIKALNIDGKILEADGD